MAFIARFFVPPCLLLLATSYGCSPAPAEGDGTGTPEAPACPLGAVQCASGCADLQQSAANCGACDHACPPDRSCKAGVCTCPEGLTSCGELCVDLQSDATNCGNCGVDCTTAGQVCSLGACSTICAQGLTLCGAGCVDLTSSRDNCGQCGTVCSPAQICAGSLCGCASGMTPCGIECLNTASDPLNCGACGVACAGGATCQSGVCVGGQTGSGGTGGVDGSGGTGNTAGTGATAGTGGTAGTGAAPATGAAPGTGGISGTGGTDPVTGSGVTFSPPSGTFEGSLAVTLAVADAGAEIRYTLDGTAPTAASTLFAGSPIAVTASTQIIAQAFSSGIEITEPAAAVYVQRAIDVTVDLPLLVLDSYGAGNPEGDGESSPWMPTPADRPFMDAALLVYEDVGATLSGTPTLATRAGFHLRGNSSAMFPKPPYRLELRNPEGEDARHEMLGMPADGDWVLRNPYADKALMRDAFFYGLAADLGFKAPRFAFCELYRNGGPGPVDAEDYLGVYLLVETIENSSSRIDLEQLKEEHRALPEISGGYIFKFEWSAVEEPEVECLSATHCWSDLEVVDPVPLNVEQESWLEQHLSGFADALFGGSFGDPSAGYAPYIDVGSFVDQVILNELGREMDAYIRSQHFHKDRDGKIFAGPIWDRDLTFGVGGSFENDQIEGWQYEQTARSGGGTGFPGMANPGNDWFPRLMEEPGFVASVVARWKELRQGQLSDAQLDARVDTLAAPLAAAAVRNFAKWDILTTEMVPANMFHTTTEDTWEGQVASMRSWMHQRVAWLDTQWQ